MIEIKVLIVEDQDLVREGIAALLSQYEEISLVSDGVESGERALRQVELYKPDVVLMDVSLTDTTGVDVTRDIKRKFPRTRILMLTGDDTERRVAASMRAGADGYIIKTAPHTELHKAILAVAEGKTYLDPSFDPEKINEVAEDLSDEATIDQLTPREREVMRLIADGHTNSDISQMLQIGVKTVEIHRSNMMRKLGLHNTAEVTAFALREGLSS